MPLPSFHYHEPTRLMEACQILAEHGERAGLLAGGTDLLVGMKTRVVSPEHIVSLTEIEELTGIDHSNDLLRIGACHTVAELALSPKLRSQFNALVSGAESLGSPQIRNLATIGGNLVTARPAADLPPSLIAHGARATLKRISGERTVPLDEFFLGPGKTVMEPDEILTEILIESPQPNTGSSYIKLGHRRALAISIVNVAASITLDEKDGIIQSARVVLGAVAPTPIRAVSAERLLMGEKPNDSLFGKVGKEAATECIPIDDFRGSSEYRRTMVAVLTQRALDMALGKA